MFGNGGLRERQLADNLTAHTRFFPGEQAQNLDSCGMPDSFGEEREFLVRLRPLNGPKVERPFQARRPGSTWVGPALSQFICNRRFTI